MAISKTPGEALVEASEAGTGLSRRSFLLTLAGAVGATVAAAATLPGCGMFNEGPKPGCDVPLQGTVKLNNIKSTESTPRDGSKSILTSIDVTGITEARKLCKGGAQPVLFLVVQYKKDESLMKETFGTGGFGGTEGKEVLNDGTYSLQGLLPNDRDPGAPVIVRVELREKDSTGKLLANSSDEVFPV